MLASEIARRCPLPFSGSALVNRRWAGREPQHQRSRQSGSLGSCDNACNRLTSHPSAPFGAAPSSPSRRPACRAPHGLVPRRPCSCPSSPVLAGRLDHGPSLHTLRPGPVPLSLRLACLEPRFSDLSSWGPGTRMTKLFRLTTIRRLTAVGTSQGCRLRPLPSPHPGSLSPS